MKPYVFKKSYIHKATIVITAIVALLYISWWFNFSHIGNPYMYAILLTGEIYYLLMTAGYWFTIWKQDSPRQETRIEYSPTIDIYIPVCGEPITLIKETIEAVLAMQYKDKCVGEYPDCAHVYVLNDSYIASKDNWKKIIELKEQYPIEVITRIIPGGAKAGNINHALALTRGEYVVIFDSDMKPYPDFLKKVMGYFAMDDDLAFVQTPQYYENFDQNYVTDGAWAQQSLFFGAICKGKDTYNSTFCCGTNVVFRKEVLKEVGGFDRKNIAEDFATSLAIHANQWHTIYYPEILARGFAPMNLQEYYSQQLRWAKGCIDVFFHNNPLLKRGLTKEQKIQYLLSLGFYFMGIFILLDAIIPVIYLLTGIVPVKGNSTTYILIFVPYMTMLIYILSTSTGGKLTYKALQFSVGSFYIQIIALLCTLTNKKMGFKVTSKTSETKVKTYYRFVWMHIIYTIVGLGAIIHAMTFGNISPALITNSAWIIFSITMFWGHIYAAFPFIEILSRNIRYISRKLQTNIDVYEYGIKQT